MTSSAQAIAELTSGLAERLISRKQTLATAESCTGGMIATYCTDLAGSSVWFNGGIVSYSNAMKIKLLGVDDTVLEQQGAVSAGVAEQMAWGAIRACGANLSIATTGIAGPGGGVAGKPVGTVWLASVVNHQLASTCQHFSGTRDEVRQATVAFALNWLINRIDSEG